MKPSTFCSFFRLPLLLLLLAVLSGCVTRPPADSPPEDFHVGIWLNRHIMQEGEEAIAAFLDDAAARGITAVYPNFWFHGYAIYPDSKLVEQHPDFQGWNPLAVVLREAQKRDLEVHAWGEYGFFTHYNFTDSQEEVGYILQRHPAWISENREGRISLHNAQHGFSHYSLNPGHPEARRFLRDLMLEVVRLHPDLTGLNLDRIRYQGSDFSYDRFSRESFAAKHGFDPLQIGPGLDERARWDQWRVEQINAFMGEMSKAFSAEFPDKTLSAAVLPPYMMDDKFQRWDQAVAQGHLQVPIPMIYGHPDLVRREIDRSAALLPPGTKLYIGLDVAALSPQELLSAVDYARTRGAHGVVLWDDTQFRLQTSLQFK
jgi:uncharacterized lipoprotein YddW (UPF0748 family)